MYTDPPELTSTEAIEAPSTAETTPVFKTATVFAVPPETRRSAPGLRVMSFAVPSAKTMSAPPELTVVLFASPAETCRCPFEYTVVSLTVPPETGIPPPIFVVSVTTPPSWTVRESLVRMMPLLETPLEMMCSAILGTPYNSLTVIA